MKNIFISYSYRKMNEVMIHELTWELEHLGYNVLNKEKEEINSNFQLQESMGYLLEKSSIFLFIMSDYNPTQFIELGYAMALSKKVLVIADYDIDIPDELRHINFLRIDLKSSESIYHILNNIKKLKVEERDELIEIATINQLIQLSYDDTRFLDKISGLEFENLMFNYFQEIGMEPERPESNRDYGFDFVLRNYKNYNKTIVEVKKYSQNSKVSVNTIHQVFGTLNIYEADHALIITTSDFTSSAKDFVSKMYEKVELWNIENLIEQIRTTHNNV